MQKQVECLLFTVGNCKYYQILEFPGVPSVSVHFRLESFMNLMEESIASTTFMFSSLPAAGNVGNLLLGESSKP